MARSRLMTAAMLQGGVFVNLVEYPAVSKNGCRWRLQAMAAHEDSDIAALLDMAASAHHRYPG